MPGVLPFPIRQSKLQRPRVLTAIVPRPQLWSLLDHGTEGPLTLVCAGPGFGKTTLVTSWLNQRESSNPTGRPLPAAWLSLDEHDDDVVVFLHYFIAALRTVSADACAATLALLQSPRTPRMPVLSTALQNDLMQLGHDVTVVLDDFSLLPGIAVSQLLDELLRAWPQRLHLVIITRRNPALSLPALRAIGLLAEIRSQQLRFSSAETADYLRRALATAPSAAEIDTVEQQTEGWITGIKLAALAWSSIARQTTSVPPWAVNAGTSLEYLAEEVLAKQPPAVQHFLHRTAILDHFCVDLGAVLVGPGEPGWDAAACIDWLVHGDLFTITLDRDGEWFRYHHLLRELLQRRLVDTATPAEIGELRRKAAHWFADHGLIEDALHHALEAHDLDLASQLIAQELPHVLNREETATLERWLSLLPADYVETRPELLLVKAWVLQFKWQLGALARIIDQVEGLQHQQRAAQACPMEPIGAPDNVELQLSLLRGQTAFFRNQPDKAIKWLLPTLAEFPVEYAFLRSRAALYTGMSMQAGGNFAGAERWLLDQFERHPYKKDGFAVRLCVSLGFCYLAEAKFEQVAQVAGDLLRQSQVAVLATMQSWAHYFLGLVHYYRNKLDRAEAHFSAVPQYQHTAVPLVVYHGLSHLALIHQLRGRRAEAARVLESLRKLDLDTGGRVSDGTHALAAWLCLLQGKVDRALTWAHALRAPVPDSPLLWLTTPHLIQARILLAGPEHADLLTARRNLNALAEVADRTSSRRFAIEILALRAMVHHRLHDDQAAEADLRRSLALAAHGGCAGVYVGLGPEMADLLRQLQRTGLNVGPLLAQFAAAQPFVVSPAVSNNSANRDDGSAQPLRIPLPAAKWNDGLVEPLTMREMEVLALLREPLSMKEIARRLVVADSTVKRHTINVYGKLGVNRRWDAVAKATALGYLPER